MATRQCQPIERAYPQLPDALAVAGFVVATAAALLQITWWFSHGWTWSNLAGFLMSGQAVTWCVVLILLGASLSWLGLRRADYGAEGREWAAAGLAISALAAAPIMLGLLLIVVFLLLVGAPWATDPGVQRRPGDSSGRSQRL